jgi:hypothetical protein
MRLLAIFVQDLRFADGVAFLPGAIEGGTTATDDGLTAGGFDISSSSKIPSAHASSHNSS